MRLADSDNHDDVQASAGTRTRARVAQPETSRPEHARSEHAKPRPGRRARRLLAVFAFVVCLLGVIGVFVAPAAAPAAIQQTTPSPVASTLHDAAGPFDPLGAPPQLCSACLPPAAPWTAPGVSPIVDGAGNAPHVDPHQVAAATNDPPPDRRFGVVQAFTAPYAASYAGIGWERVNFDWCALQPAGPHGWNRAAVSGAMINDEIAHGREIVGIIGCRPPWAAGPHGLPSGLYLAPDDPRNSWGAFVAELARRYRGRVRHWIIWNEPDVWNAGVAGYTWPGTVTDFAQLQRVAYLQIKRVAPTLVVHLAATTYWWDAAYGRPLYFARLLDALAADPAARRNNWYFDVASAHIYNVPDDVARILRIDRGLMHAHGFGKPIWLNETGAAPTSDGPWKVVDLTAIATVGEQAAFVVQASALALVGGAARIEFYKMTDPADLSPHAYPAGLMRPDGTARPAIAALRATTHALAGAMRASDLGQTGTVRAIAVDRGARGATLVLWNTTAQPVEATVSIPIGAGDTQAELDRSIAAVGDDDARLPVTPALTPATGANGRGVPRQATLQLTLAPSACAASNLCRIGGPPVMVVAPAMPHLLG